MLQRPSQLVMQTLAKVQELVWLDKLLAPGTEHKAGDTVHLQVGSCSMQAIFSGSPPSWQLTALPPSPLNLAITAASQRVESDLFTSTLQVQVMGDPAVAVGGNQQQHIDEQVSEDEEQAYSTWLSRRSAHLAQLWSTTFLAIILSCALRSAQEGVLVKEIPTHLTLALPYILSGLLAAQGYFRAYEPSQVLHALVRAGVLMSGCLGFTVFPSSYSNGYMAHIDTWAEVLLHTPAEHVRVPILVLNRVLLTCSAWCMTRYHYPDMGPQTLAYRVLTPLLGSLA
ncbi:hypothetical protein HaLaN_13044, partial [Haematococcus lacustris]